MTKFPFSIAPFDFPKLHGCLPKQCKCRGQKRLKASFYPGTYLKTLIGGVEQITGDKVSLVSSHVMHNEMTICADCKLFISAYSNAHGHHARSIVD